MKIELHAPVTLNAAAADGKAPDKPARFEMLGYTGDVLNLGWGSFIIDLAGIDIGDQRKPILKEHNRAAICGFSDEIKRDGGGLKLAGVLSQSTDAGREVLQLGKEGFPWQASVGLQSLELTEVKPGAKTKVNGRELAGPALIVAKSVLKECSFVALGADPNTRSVVLSDEGTAALKGMLASIGDAAPKTEPSKGNGSMEYKDIQLSDLRAQRPDLVKQIVDEDRKRLTAIGTAIEATGAPASVKGELTQRCAALSLEDAQNVIARTVTIEAALAAAKLPASVEKALRADCEGKSQFVALALINETAAACKRPGSPLVTAGDGALNGSDPENKKEDPRKAIALKAATDFKFVSHMPDLTLSAFVGQRLADANLSATDAEIEALLK